MTYTTVTVQLQSDTIDEIVSHELNWHLDSLKDDLKKRKKGKGVAIFSIDKEEDVAQLKEHIKAYKLILAYHSPPKK